MHNQIACVYILIQSFLYIKYVFLDYIIKKNVNLNVNFLEQLRNSLQNFNWNGMQEEYEGAKEEIKRSCGFIACTLEKQRMVICNNYYTNKLLGIKNSDKKYSAKLKQL